MFNNGTKKELHFIRKEIESIDVNCNLLKDWGMLFENKYFKAKEECRKNSMIALRLADELRHLGYSNEKIQNIINETKNY